MGKRVYVSPSGQEGNAYAVGGTEEQYMNQVADVIEAVLKRHGVEVRRNNPSMTLQQMVLDSNQYNPDVHAAIHSNSGGGHWAEVFCYKFGAMGEDLARLVYKYVSGLTPGSDRGVKQGYNFYGKGSHMYEVTYTNAPAFLVECAFHDTIEEANWIVGHINELGIAISKGILEYLGITYQEPVQLHPSQPQTDVLYRVMCGSYANRDNALHKIEQLKAAGFDAVLMPFQK